LSSKFPSPVLKIDLFGKKIYGIDKKAGPVKTGPAFSPQVLLL